MIIFNIFQKDSIQGLGGEFCGSILLYKDHKDSDCVKRELAVFLAGEVLEALGEEAETLCGLVTLKFVKEISTARSLLDGGKILKYEIFQPVKAFTAWDFL